MREKQLPVVMVLPTYAYLLEQWVKPIEVVNTQIYEIQDTTSIQNTCKVGTFWGWVALQTIEFFLELFPGYNQNIIKQIDSNILSREFQQEGGKGHANTVDLPVNNNTINDHFSLTVIQQFNSTNYLFH